MYDKVLFSERLKELRNTTGKTQKQFAEFVESTPATISAYENGTKNPSLEVVANIAKKCSVSLDWLCGLDEIKMQFSIITYADAFRVLLNLQKAGIPFFEIKHEWVAGKTSPVIILDNEKIVSFIKDLEKMSDLLNNKVIDQDVYDLWLEKSLQKADVRIK